MAFCTVCEAMGVEIRLDMQEGAYGPLHAPICQECYEADAAERRAEGKRFGYRPKIVPWSKLEICSQQEGKGMS